MHANAIDRCPPSGDCRPTAGEPQTVTCFHIWTHLRPELPAVLRCADLEAVAGSGDDARRTADATFRALQVYCPVRRGELRRDETRSRQAALP
jgi:hypothetical protein